MAAGRRAGHRAAGLNARDHDGTGARPRARRNERSAGAPVAVTWGGQPVRRPGRWEFVGVIAEDRVRKRYVNRFVGFAPGAQNPLSYANLD